MIQYTRTPPEHAIQQDAIIFDGVEPIDLAATLECGQAFRWRSCGPGAYSGIVESEILRVFLEGDRLTLVGTTPEKAGFWSSYFALDLNYSAIQEDLCKTRFCTSVSRSLRAYGSCDNPSSRPSLRL